jgi:hypothetical protein
MRLGKREEARIDCLDYNRAKVEVERTLIAKGC